MLPVNALVKFGLKILGEALAERLVRMVAAGLGIKLADDSAKAPQTAADGRSEETASATPPDDAPTRDVV